VNKKKQVCDEYVYVYIKWCETDIQTNIDEPVLRAIHHLFNNRFMKAKKIFEQQAKSDPLYALGLGSMVFLKGKC
jgi:hypothetical protein